MSDAPHQNDLEKLNGSSETVIKGEEKTGEVERKESVDRQAVDEVGGPSGTDGTEENTKIDNGAIKQEGADEVSTSDTTPNAEAEIRIEVNDGDKAPGPESSQTDQAGASTESRTEATPAITTSGEPTSSVEPPVLPSPSLTHNSLRPLSPSSRTSTPPLTGTLAPAAKKFSASNVNKKFLSKTGTTPSPSNASPATKLNSLSSESAHNDGVMA